MHWILPRDRDPEHLMVSFDFSIELFHEIAMPEDFGKTDMERVSVALFQIDNREYFVFRLHLWVMKEYSAVKSWTNLITIVYSSKDNVLSLLVSIAVMNW
ncbi:hypothetical protein DVH24_041115 [Malus domestica]|uniref:Uncharacterized protein n=1 Tax=Malus domestica TaxID=3750 RepID=A0A498I887_MALDO|nr:hypothetical protein DVH24_041115 [Malus domestica]